MNYDSHQIRMRERKTYRIIYTSVGQKCVFISACFFIHMHSAKMLYEDRRIESIELPMLRKKRKSSSFIHSFLLKVNYNCVFFGCCCCFSCTRSTLFAYFLLNNRHSMALVLEMSLFLVLVHSFPFHYK